MAKIYKENNNKIHKKGFLFYIHKNKNIKDKVYVRLNDSDGIRIWNYCHNNNNIDYNYEYKKPKINIVNLEDYQISLSHVSAYENTFALLGNGIENVYLFQCNSKKEAYEWINAIAIIQSKKKKENEDQMIFQKTTCTTIQNISFCVIT